MSAPIQSLYMLILMQPDIEKAIAFYQRLGFTLIFSIKERWAEMQLGDIKIGLCPTGQTPPIRSTGIVFQVADVHDLYSSLKDTITFFAEPKEAAHGIMASIQDPGNNVLDIYQPTPEKVAEPVKTANREDREVCNKASSTGCCKQKRSCR